jgi:glycosyl transferase, family 25
VPVQAIPVFAISLARAPERRDALVRHLRRLSVEFECFDAVDGRSLHLPDPRRVHPECGIPPGQVACCLSHFRIYERIVADQIPVACVMEDDGRLRPAAVRLLREGCASLDFDVCQFDSADRNNRGVVCFDPDSAVPLAPGIRAYTLSDGPHGTHLYLITAAAAEKRLKYAFPIRETIDCYEHLPIRLHFRAVLPRAGFVSVLSRSSLALDRTQTDRLPPLFAWRGLPGFHWIRDELNGRAAQRREEIRSKQARGDLTPGRRWRPLPAGREIMPE